jgi:F-type H+-transporting ATPase subunit b
VLIDWFTVVAQIVNFLVLVALLKRFLWGKLTQAIDEREARVAGELAKAEQKNKEAQLLAEQLHAQAAEQERKREEMLVQAHKETDEERARLVQEARESVVEMERKWHEELDREQAAFFRELRTRAAAEVLTVIRRALADLSSAELQQCVIDVFLDKLRGLDIAALREMGPDGKLVRSAVELPEADRQKIEAILKERLGTLPKLKYEKDPAMAWGIELRGNGRRIGWNPESYLDAMEENLRGALERRAEIVDREVVR